MDSKTLIIVIATVLLLAYLKIRNMIFKAKDSVLVKDDEALETKQEHLKKQVDALKIGVNVPDLKPEEIEVFWQGKKK